MEHLETIRRAMHDALHHNPAGVKADAVAFMTGRNRSVVYGWGEGKQIPLDGLIQVVRLTKDLGPVMALAAACDCACFPIKHDIPNKQVAVKALKEFSDLMQAHAAAVMDGTITQDELSRIKKASTRAITAIVCLTMESERVFQED